MSRFTENFAKAIITLGVIAGSASALAAQPLKVAGQDVPPWVVHAKDSNAFSGIFVDLTNAIAKDAGLQVDYQVMTFADLIPALTSGKIDVIATEMVITPARAQKVDFSIPVYNAPREAVVVLASDPTTYHHLADLRNVPVGVQKGSIQYALLQKTGGFSDLKVYDTIKDVWSAVASGQVKAAVTAGADTIFAAKQGELPNLRIVSSYQSPSPIPRVGIAVRKGNSELLGKINSSLAKLEADGTVKAIFAKYGVDDWAIDSQPRPSRLSNERDFPGRALKPADATYPPLLGPFPPPQHLTGPWQPIRQWQNDNAQSLRGKSASPGG